MKIKKRNIKSYLMHEREIKVRMKGRRRRRS